MPVDDQKAFKGFTDEDKPAMRQCAKEQKAAAGHADEESGKPTMKAQSSASPHDQSASRQIDAIISMHGDWRGQALAHLRALIKAADPAVVEDVKWKKPSRPEGVPVWSHDGIICVADTLKRAVRLTFPKGAQLQDPQRLFNARRDSNAVRAIDVHEGDTVDAAALRALILAAVGLNQAKAR